jgi:5-formyltetrahydrofolate cyclo-ligase
VASHATLLEFRTWCRASREQVPAWKLCAVEDSGDGPAFFESSLATSGQPTVEYTVEHTVEYTVAYFDPLTRLGEPAQIPTWPRPHQACWPTADLHFALCDPEKLELDPRWGVRMAPPGSRKASPDLVFVPCEAADSHGHRIGRGGGFYDQLLSRYPDSHKVGVVHESRVYDSFPKHWIQTHDVAMDALWTDCNFYWISQAHSKRSTL